MAKPLPYISTRKYIKWGDEPAGENTDTLVLTTPQKYYVDIRIFLPLPPSPTTLPASKLEWGFAGPSLSTPSTSTKPAHTIWTHWVDSTTTEQVQDEGDMHPQPNGEVLEYGSMKNPVKGVEEKYEECWVDLEIGGSGRGWVLRTEGEGVNGMAARIGEYTQAVVRKGDEVHVGRWKGGELAVGVGEASVPVVGEGVKEGDKVLGKDGLEWICLESFEW